VEITHRPFQTGPLSHTEENAWREFKSDPDLFFHRGAVLSVDLRPGAGRNEAKRILHTVARRHDVFRTAYDTVAGGAQRQVLPDYAHKIMEADAAVYPIIGESRTTLLPDDLARVWLTPGPDGRKRLSIDFNELITDSWSCARLQTELIALAESDGEATDDQLGPVGPTYAEYAAEQRSQPLPAASVDFWRSQLAGIGPSDFLEQDGPDPSGDVAGERVVIFSDDMTAAVRTLCRDLRLSPFMVVVTLVKMVLAARTGSRDITLSTTTGGRARKWTDVQGNFSNVILLRSLLPSDPSFVDLLSTTRTEVLSALRHQAVPFGQLPEILGTGPIEAPVRVHYLPHRAHHYRLLDSRPSGDAWIEDAVFAGHPMEIGFAEDKRNRFAIWMSYDPKRYRHSSAGELLQACCDTLRMVAADPALTCGHLGERIAA
jgi:hypothetical protein